MRQGPSPRRVRELSARFGADESTIIRWRTFWREHFPQTPFWKVARASFLAVGKIVSLPSSLVDAFLRRHPPREGWILLINDVSRQGIAYVPFFPIGGFTPLQSSTLSDVVRRLGSTPMQVALAWLLHRSPNILLDSSHVVDCGLAREPGCGAVDAVAASLGGVGRDRRCRGGDRIITCGSGYLNTLPQGVRIPRPPELTDTPEKPKLEQKEMKVTKAEKTQNRPDTSRPLSRLGPFRRAAQPLPALEFFVSFVTFCSNALWIRCCVVEDAGRMLRPTSLWVSEFRDAILEPGVPGH